MYTTTNAIKKLLGDKYENCQSPSLRLEKFLILDSNSEAGRSREIEQIVECCNKFAKQLPLERKFTNAINLVARLEGNLIINQSGGILENAGLCLDRLRGYPYIPGSAIKGVAHHAAWQEWSENPSPELALRIAKVFGYPTQQLDLDNTLKKILPEKMDPLAGAVSFLAAVPCGLDGEKVKLGKDICTSHHPNYYQGKQAHAYDNENPIPLLFPVVQSGAQFLFQIVPLSRADEKICEDARRWLIKAICENGLGAKTAAGYGWFSFDAKVSEQELQKISDHNEKRKTERDKIREEQIRQDEEKIRLVRIAKDKAAEKARLASMTPEQACDEEISKLTPEQFLERLGRFCLVKGRQAIEPAEKAALLRALKGPRHEVWEQIRVMKRGKNTPNWPQITNEIFVLHKELYNGEKMS